jgi:hypothetical protein
MRKSESNIAYIGVDMVHVTNPAAFAMSVINHLQKQKPRAWFVDIVHTGPQIPRALQLQELLQKELEARHPWQIYGGHTITICLNLSYSHRLKAREKMNAELERTPNVRFRDPSGKEQPIEY